MADFVFMFQT